MIRKIITIDEEKCNGCGLCADACHEGAIAIVNGKARLLRDDYCDGLGNCLPVCPMDAISFVEREALPYDEEAVKTNMANKLAVHTGCPGSRQRTMESRAENNMEISSQLSQWPVQIKLAPVNAPYFDGADLLVAADCTAYAYGNFHNDFIRGEVTLIGCPKLDATDYSEKLAEIIRRNDIKSITVTRMEVPCCGGLEYMVKKALADSGKTVDLNVTTISIDGNIM